LSNLAKLEEAKTPMESTRSTRIMGLIDKFKRPSDLAVSLDSTEETTAPTLDELEAQVQTGLESFATAGRALAAIKSRKLYRPGFTSWESYLVERWRFTGDYATKLITAAAVADELVSAGLPQPLRESHARELKKIPTEHRGELWQAAIADAGGIDNVTAEQIASKGAKHRKPKARHKKPKAVTLRGKGWVIVVSRKTADLDILAILDEATDQLEAKAAAAKAA
jgi:hypothetical protein